MTIRVRQVLKTMLLSVAAVVLGLGVLAAALFYEAFYYRPATGVVGKALAHALMNETHRPIVVAQLTRFEWDELYVFGPYYPRDWICNCLELAEPRCFLTVADSGARESEMLLVFRRNKSVIHSESHFRINGDFMGSGGFVQPLTPTTAVFDLEAAGRSVSGFPWRALVLHDGINVASSTPALNRPCGNK